MGLFNQQLGANGGAYPGTGGTSPGGMPNYYQQNVTPMTTGQTAPMVDTETGATVQATDYGNPTAALSRLSEDQYAQVPDWVKQETGSTLFNKMADGGHTTSPVVMVGDPKAGSNKPNREFLFNPTGAPLMVVPADKMGEAPKMADGGTVGGLMPWDQQLYFGRPTDPNAVNTMTPDQQLTRARETLFNAFNPAMQKFQQAVGGPTAGGVPTPVGVSAPGTSPDLQEAASGLAAAGAGVRRSTFFNDLLKSRAQGINQGINRRTR
jgi:hypothetical protein